MCLYDRATIRPQGRRIHLAQSGPFDRVVRFAADHVAERGQELKQNRDRIGFRTRLDQSNEFASQAVEGLAVDRLRPSGRCRAVVVFSFDADVWITFRELERGEHGFGAIAITGMDRFERGVCAGIALGRGQFGDVAPTGIVNRFSNGRVERLRGPATTLRINLAARRSATSISGLAIARIGGDSA